MRRFHVSIHRGVLLVDVREIEEGVVLHLVTIVPAAARDVGVVMEVAVAVATEVAEKCAVVVKRAKLSGVVLSRVIGRKIDDDFDSV